MNIVPAVPCEADPPESFLQERSRSLELAKYFTAASIVPRAPQPDLETPAPFPDPTLTALAQLGVYKLECERSFISLIDSSHQYIIGEATRSNTSSPQGLKAHNDGLYLGFRSLELSWGVCPQTIKVFTSDDMTIDTPNVYADHSRYVIHNFEADAHFATRPYVTGFPYMRSYAEVPLTSPSGFVIGSYCVVDDKPRDYNDAEIATLADVASNIMSHLDLMKSRLEFQRVEGLVRGIGSYVAGVSSLREQRTMLASMDVARPPAIRQVPDPTDTSAGSSTRSPSTESVPSTHISPAQSTSKTTTESADVSFARKTSFLASESSQSILEPEQNTILSPEVSKAFFRAGNIVHQSMELQGVAFMDTLEATTSTSQRPSTSSCTNVGLQSPAHDASNARLFGYSIEAGPRNGINPDGSNLKLKDALLARMLARYPFGHILSSDTQGVIIRSHTDLNQQYRKHPSRRTFGLVPPDDEEQEKRDAADMFRAIPMARSIIFLPLWDYPKDRWFAACIGWTSDPTRILSVADLNYFSAFGNSIMSEVSRLEAAALSDVKSNFIASVSHELRSPLHGILAGTELLRESIKSSEEVSMLDTIASCGTTLLDTVDHLLDFAKINSLITRPADLPSTADIASPEENARRFTVVDLSTLVQDVVEGVYLGFAARQPPQDFGSETAGSERTAPDTWQCQSHASDQTIVLIDVEPAINWSFETEPGAWKRIVMNLLGNALKYTSEGRINVRLNLNDQHSEEGNMENGAVCLEIVDTGCGISKEYLQHRLFLPFAQEDNLSIGTGLGLSIVQRLVEGLQGTIEVWSEVGFGTTVRVVVPIGDTLRAQGRLRKSEGTTRSQRFDDVGRLRDLQLLLPALETASPANESENENVSATRSLFASIAARSLGMDVSFDRPPAAIVDSGKHHLVLQHAGHDATGYAWVLRSIRGGEDATGDGSAVAEARLKQPFGPRQLTTALLNLLERRRGGGKSSTRQDVPSTRRKRSTSDLAKAMQSTSITSVKTTTTTTTTQQLDTPTSPNSTPDRVVSHLPNTPKPPIHIHILIVDDNPTNLKVLSMCAQKIGCTVTLAEDGQQAIDAFTTTIFDLVFMDLSMPVKDGYQATREIRTYEMQSAVSRTPIYALTALVTEQARQDALGSGVDRFISKPIRMDRVRESIWEVGEGKGREGGV